MSAAGRTWRSTSRTKRRRWRCSRWSSPWSSWSSSWWTSSGLARSSSWSSTWRWLVLVEVVLVEVLLVEVVLVVVVLLDVVLVDVELVVVVLLDVVLVVVVVVVVVGVMGWLLPLTLPTLIVSATNVPTTSALRRLSCAFWFGAHSTARTRVLAARPRIGVQVRPRNSVGRPGCWRRGR